MGSQRVEHALAAKQQQALLQGILPTGDGTQVSHIAGGVFTIWAPREAQNSNSSDQMSLAVDTNLLERSSLYRFASAR